MSLRSDLAPIVARDARYPVDAYLFVLEALDFTRKHRHPRPQPGSAVTPKPSRRRGQTPTRRRAEHVTGQELCRGACELARRLYGLMAVPVLNSWGIRTTSDLGEIVYNMIRSGDLEKTPEDSRDDFEDVFDLECELRDAYQFALEDPPF